MIIAMSKEDWDKYQRELSQANEVALARLTLIVKLEEDKTQLQIQLAECKLQNKK